jgi:hypothetical protein
VQEGREAVLLIAVQDGHAGLRRDHEGEGDGHREEREERAKCRQLAPGHEEDGEADDDVDQA